jgi:hypothetical protein
MRGQDYFYDILTGGFNYAPYAGQTGLTTEELRTHWGSIAVSAANLMLTEVNDTYEKQTVRAWLTFGDPSLQLRTKQPAMITSSGTLLPGLPFETVITANGTPVKNALVCVSKNGIYYSAITNENGEVSIPHTFVSGNVLLVVTAFNTTTIYETI